MFGSLGQPAQPSGGGLFGNPTSSQTPASQTPKPSLFSLGTQQTSQPASSGGLFGSLGTSTSASQPQQTASSGLFGNPSSAGSLFGNPSQSQPAQQSTGFPTLGQSILQPATQTGGSSLFGQAQQQQQGQQQGQTSSEEQNGRPGQSKGPSSLQAAYFDQILERGKKRNSQENGGLGDLPSLQLGLGDIARKVRNLGTGGPSAEHAKAGDSRA